MITLWLAEVGCEHFFVAPLVRQFRDTVVVMHVNYSLPRLVI